MAHYYDDDGKLIAYVPYADPKKAGQFRPTDLRDAKKLNLNPSATTVMSKINKPMVNDYRVKVALDIALNEMKFIPGIRVHDEQIKSIADRSMERAMEAADFGTAVHGLISDAYNNTVEWLGKATETQQKIANQAVLWMIANGYVVKKSEQSFVSLLGWAGTIDIIAEKDNEECVCDFKTQDALSLGDFNWYEDWPIQLAAYDLGYPSEKPRRRISIAISRLVPGLISHRDWTHDKRFNNAVGDKAWLSLWEYWKAVSNWEVKGEIKEEDMQGSLI
jgi:hypothetical protein